MRLGYIIVYVPDVAETIGFYERAFGLSRRFVHPSGEYAEMETGSTALGFAAAAFVRGNGMEFQSLRPDQPPVAMEIALVTDDVAAAVSRAAAAGAVIVQQPVKKPWGQTVAYVRDLNGTLVELCTEVAPA